jgi:hypothetical protein
MVNREWRMVVNISACPLRYSVWSVPIAIGITAIYIGTSSLLTQLRYSVRSDFTGLATAAFIA